MEKGTNTYNIFDAVLIFRIYLLGIKETNFGESHEQMCESSLFLSGFPPSNKNHGEIGPKIDQVCPPSIEYAVKEKQVQKSIRFVLYL